MKDLQLVLTNPCSEHWDDMQQAGDGRYCDHCAKTIVDLTTKSDAELIQFFKNKKDNVCGRLLSTQLDRKLVQPPSRVNWQWLMPLAVGAIVVSPAQAQKLRPVMLQSDQATAAVSTLAESTVKITISGDTISGSVVDDQTGKPLKGVKIIQKGFENVRSITDSTGRFELGITQADKATPFIFELNGYAKIETSLNDDMVVKLSAVVIVRLGGISTVSTDQKPLYLVYAGKKSCAIDASGMSEISSDWIEKIEVLKGAKATALYGSKAANGVILVEIKKAYASKIDFSKKK